MKPSNKSVGFNSLRHSLCRILNRKSHIPRILQLTIANYSRARVNQNQSNMHKVLVLLPNADDRAEAAKLDENQFEVHFLHASEDVADEILDTFTGFAYNTYLATPGFLNTYVERAVKYVEENAITAIMYSHDLSSVVASVVCDKTGLRGPSLESTFCCLHKYYSRVTDADGGKFWFDYIYLDDEFSDSWKTKVCFPCFLKAPYFTGSKGLSVIKTEAEMVVALAKLEKLVRPYFIGYSEFFRRFLDLEKFPLAVKNIVVVEELVESGDEYCIEGWVDETGKFTLWSIGYEIVSPKNSGALLCWVFPQFTLKKDAFDGMVKLTEKLGHRFGLRSTFYDAEIWKRGEEFTLIEMNARSSAIASHAYKKMWGTSIYEAAVYLACGETAKLHRIPTTAAHKDGDPISGLFKALTCGEGRGEELVDFDYARAGCLSDGVYNNGGPGVMLWVEEESLVKQVSSSNAFILGHFFLSDHSSANLFQRAKGVVSKFVRRLEDCDLFDLSRCGEQSNKQNIKKTDKKLIN